MLILELPEAELAAVVDAVPRRAPRHQRAHVPGKYTPPYLCELFTICYPAD